jgi:uncharacterized membrane protein
MSFPSHRRLIGVISAMIVWALWFVAVYSLTGIGCAAGWNTQPTPVGNVLSLAMLISAAVALVLIAWCARCGYVGWRRGDDAQGIGEEARQRMHFMGLVMLVLSVIAAIGTVLTAIPIVMLDPCAA